MISSRCSDSSACLKRAQLTTSVPTGPFRHRTPQENRSGTRVGAVSAANAAFERAKELRKSEEELRKSEDQVEVIVRKPSKRLSMVSQGFHKSSEQGVMISRRPSRRSDGAIGISRQGSHLSRANSKGRFRAEGLSQSSSHTHLPPGNRTVEVQAPNPTHLAPDNTYQIFNITSSEESFADRFDGYGLPLGKVMQNGPSTQEHTSKCLLESQSPANSPAEMSRTLTVPMATTREQQTDEAIIALARDRYLHNHQTMTLKAKSSFGWARLRKTRKSKGEGPFLDGDTSQDGANLEPVRNYGLSNHTYTGSRHVSISQQSSSSSSNSRRLSASLASLKIGWRNTFGNTATEHPGLPAQQVRASSIHYGRDQSNPMTRRNSPGIDLGTDQTCDFDDSPPLPPQHLVDVRYAGIGNPPGSTLLDTQGEFVVDRSRVTSWNDSTRRNTLALSEFGPLLSIQEDQDGGKSLIALKDHDDTTRNRLQDVSHSRTDSYSGFETSVDSRRLWSALLRHSGIKSRKPQTGKEALRHDLVEHQSMPERIDTARIPVYSIVHGVSEISDNSNPSEKASSVNVGDHHSRPETSRTATTAQELAMSPSVYSDRGQDGCVALQPSSSPSFPSTPPGIATVTNSEAVSKWSLDDAQRVSNHSTSNDWRAWASDEFSDLAGRSSFSVADFSPPIAGISPRTDATLNKSSSTVTWRPVGSSSYSGNSDLATRTSRGESGSRSILEKVRKALAEDENGHQRATNEPEDHLASDLNYANENSDIAPPLAQGNFVTPRQRDTSIEPSNIDLLSRINDQVPSTQNFAGNLVESHGGAASKEPNSPSGRRRRQGRPLDDNFLLRIRKGPYNSSTATLARVPTGSTESINLPKRSSMSSSMGTENKTPPSKGQRMAEDFLYRRMRVKPTSSGENSPAFL